jgi:hypothetical protein
LENCVAGADEVIKTLEAQSYIITKLSNEDCTKRGLIEAIEKLSTYSDYDDRVFIYFAGHGFKRNTINGTKEYSLGVFDTDSSFSNAIYFDEITKLLLFVKAKHIFIALDCCFSGFVLTRNGQEASFSTEDSKILSESNKRHRSRDILAASGENEKTYDRFPFNGPAGLSPFTYFLVQGLQGKATLNNYKGLVTSSSLSSYVRENVQKYTNGSQIPQFGTIPGINSEGEYIFLENPESIIINSENIHNEKSLNLPFSVEKQEYITELHNLYLENWDKFSAFLNKLCDVVGRRSEGSYLRVLSNWELFCYFGFAITEEEHSAYKALLDTSFGDIELESSKPRLKLYFRRVKNVLERFPLSSIPPERIETWKRAVVGIISDLGSKEDDALVIRRVEDFAKSALALSRFNTTAHDPELKAALYLIKKIDYADKGGSSKVMRFLLEKIRKELEDSSDFSSKVLFTDYLDDESNFWWGLLALMDHSIEDFQLHSFRGLSGSIKILERLINKEKIVTCNYSVARKEAVFEIHNEYETILWINNLGFLISQILEKNLLENFPETLRQYVIGLQKPYIFGDSLRPRNNLFFWSLELEVWGRIIDWYDGKPKDHVGRLVTLIK